MYEQIVRPILFALSHSDNERAHELAVAVGGLVQRSPYLLRRIERAYRDRTPAKPVEVAGILFPNRIGLAAGFDKQALLIPLTEALGFGFTEIGTVPPLPQHGNPRPRLYRISEDSALCNRMGFNSDGADAITARLARARPKVRFPIGVSLGKQKDTPLEDAAQDYLRVRARVSPYADFYVINVSSPNTTGLRKLQMRDALEPLVRAVVRAEAEEAKRLVRLEKPVFIKYAPDMEESALEESVEAAVQGGGRGLTLGNTTLNPSASFNTAKHREVSGGWSGPHLFARTLKLLKLVRSWTDLPIVSVGGVGSPEQVSQLRDEGTDLIQVLTALVYQGPSLIGQLRRAT